MQVRDVQM